MKAMQRLWLLLLAMPIIAIFILFAGVVWTCICTGK